MAHEVRRHIQGTHAALAGEHDAAVLGQLHVLGRVVEVECLGLRDVGDGELLRRAHVDEAEIFALIQPGLDCLAVNLHAGINFLSVLDRADHLGDVEDVVILADLCQRVRGLESAGGAASHVVALEQRALGGRSDMKNLLHGHGGLDGEGGTHGGTES